MALTDSRLNELTKNKEKNLQRVTVLFKLKDLFKCLKIK
ncbi:hypothetical protein OIU76_003143 [Salix suchowensis]|nr:hypothetical protein OIU76_003143 [Salix suchowensis]